MATRKTVAKSRARTKRRAEKPVDSEIRRAAKRAGIGQPVAPSALTPEDEEALRRPASMSLGARAARLLVEDWRGRGLDRDQIAFLLRDEAGRLGMLAEAYVPKIKEPTLAAALELVDMLEKSFERDSLPGKDPTNVLWEALQCAKEDLEATREVGSEGPTGISYRAELRIELALKLYAFRKAHGYPKAASEQTAGGAS